MRMSKIWMLVLPLLLMACSERTRLETAMQKAGKNKVELEKVLNHYKDDSLKYKAACFLIENMPWHYAYEGWQLDSLKALKRASIQDGPITDSVIGLWRSFDYTRLPKVEDVKTITAELLIDNIDLAFEQWERRPWSKYYSFDDFCEYILPYRIDDEPLENWRRTYHDRYAPVLDSLYQGTDVMEAAGRLARYLKDEMNFKNYTDFVLPHLGANYLFRNRVGFCRENCDIAIYAMRSVGIPIAFDFYEISPNRNSGHYYSSIIDTTHLAIQFNYHDEPLQRPALENREKGKILRLCYDFQPPKIPNLYERTDVSPKFRRPLLRDVTLEYFPGTGVSLSWEGNAGEQPAEFVYLSLYNGQAYIPIDIAENKGNTASFTGVEQGFIYYPTMLADGKQQSVTYPFMLRDNKPEYFVPNLSDTTTVCLRRKYPMFKIRDFLKNSEGAKIEAANKEDFSDAVLLYEAPSPLTRNFVILDYEPKIGPYRYFRYSAPENRKIEIGEFHIYEQDGPPSRPVAMKSNHPWNRKFSDKLRAIYDGQWHTFFLSEYDGEQLTLDFGNPISIDGILYVPRNDDNYVREQDNYELFYHAGRNGWVSLGRQRAMDDSIHFHGVPANSVLWLHDHTRGREERPFYMKDGQQVFP